MNFTAKVTEARHLNTSKGRRTFIGKGGISWHIT